MVLNRTCPRSGRPVSADALTTYRGVTVGFCDPGCRDDFAAHVEERPDDRRWFDALIAERRAVRAALPAQPVLESERLVLRPHEDADADAIYAMYADPEVARFTSRPPMAERAEAVELLRRVTVDRDGATMQWALVRRADDVLVGTALLFRMDPVHRRAEVGFALARHAWRQGFAREGVRRMMRFGEQGLALLRFEADVDPANVASLRTLDALGFRREGYAHRRWRVGGGAQDSVLLARVVDLPSEG